MSQHQVVSRKTPIGTLRLSPQWHSQLALFPLKRHDFTQEKTREHLAQLLQEIGAERTSLPPFQFHQELAHRVNSGRATDSQQWRVHLGDDDDSFMQGVVVVERPGTHARTHAVLVHSGGGDAAAQLHAFVLANPTMTVGELIDRPEYALAEQYAVRNARRIAALIGGAFTTAGIATVMDVEPDRATHRPHPQIAAEPLAVPSHHVAYNCFDTVNLSSEGRNGTWTLRVQDAAAIDTGRIDSWTLNL